MKFLILLLVPVSLSAQFSRSEINRWEKQAKNVTIIRDNYGIPHIYGKSDADAVFGLLYAQCEDDFSRVEMNYIEKLGRMAEVKGESQLYDDLLIRLIIDSSDAKKDYVNAPDWLKKLMNAFADGINFYLYKHPSVKPALLKKFQPWFPLLWTDGSIGAINTADVTVAELKRYYSMDGKIMGKTTSFENTPKDAAQKQEDEILTGSNGFAFSPKITESGHSILYINPHVTFYFRPEVHMVSEEGLNVYGAVTWGQFFVYQGFNEHCGWMHTSSGVDAADSYIEHLSPNGNGWVYQYEKEKLPVTEKMIRIYYKKDTAVIYKDIKALFTKHGPIMTNRNGEYISVRADNRIMNGLIQCWQRNKTKSFADYKKTMELLGNISNNTVYADAEGNIAYWHGNRVPIRDSTYNWNLPVDGSSGETEWKGYHKPEETVHIFNPDNGWLQNCNSTPYTVAGANSPKRSDYPAYMAPDGENFRGINAVRVLSEGSNYNIDKVIKAGYDPRLSAFEVLIPALTRNFDKMNLNGEYNSLADPIALLKGWDYKCGDTSTATTLAINWGTKILSQMRRDKRMNHALDAVDEMKEYAAIATPVDLINPLSATIDEMKRNYGTWKLAWGEVNRFQRISNNIDSKFDDALPSLPMGYASSTWGMLPSYSSSFFPGTKKRYGINGNSFICVVEFGEKVKAKSLLAGGESGDPDSKHFFDQGLMYTKGQFKDVLFYKEDVMQHVEKKYHPGALSKE